MGRLKAVAHFRVRPLMCGFLPIYVKIFRATAYVRPKRQKIAKIVKNRKKWSKIAKIVKNRQKIAIKIAFGTQAMIVRSGRPATFGTQAPDF